MKDTPIRTIRFRGVVIWPWFGIEWLGRIGLRRVRKVDFLVGASASKITIHSKAELIGYFEEVFEP